METLDARFPGFSISTDPARLDVAVIHGFLAQSYWSPGIPEATVRRALANSLCFGVFFGADQVGFARVVTDRATFGYLADVFVLPEHRGRGLSKWLVAVVLEHPELQGLRRLLLATRDAHGLYLQLGFKPVAVPGNFMDRHDPDVYKRTSERSRGS